MENYRKLRNTRETEPIRYHCACLKLIHNRYGKNPANKLELRNFVVACLSFAGIEDFPDPSKHGDILDEWINTVISPLNPEIHHQVAIDLVKNKK